MGYVKYYPSNTQTSAGTADIVYDLLGPNVELGTPTTLLNQTNLDTFTDALSFNANILQDYGGYPKSSEFYMSIDVSALSGTLEYRFRMERLSSGSTSLNQTEYSPLYTTTGIKTHTFTGVTAANGWLWEDTDIIHLTTELRRSAGHGNVSITINVNDLDSFVEFRQIRRINVS